MKTQAVNVVLIGLAVLSLFATACKTSGVNRGQASDPKAATDDGQRSATALLEAHRTPFDGLRTREWSHSPDMGTGGQLLDVWPCDVGLQASSRDAWHELTEDERMLARGYEVLDSNGGSYEPRPRLFNPVQKVVALLTHFYRKNGRAPETQDELLYWAIEISREHARGVGEDALTEDEILELLYIELQSPVTGKLLEWDHQNFSPGNAFIRVVDTDERAAAQSRQSLEALYARDPLPGLDPSRDAVEVYYRVYGERGIINGGIWRASWNG